MVLVAISIILTIVANGVIIYLKKEEDIKVPQWYGLFPLIIILFGCFKIIPTGYVGVETFFGKVTGTSQEGLMLKSPLTDISNVNTKVQKKTVTGLEGSTKDLQMISNITIDINYAIIPERVMDLYSRVGMDYENVVISPAIAQSIKSQISQYNAESLANARNDVAQAMTNDLNDYLANYGIAILSVSLTNFDFSPEYNKAIEAKAVAAQETQAAEQRLAKAKIEAEQKKVEAQGQAEANKLLQSTLTDLVIKEKFLEKWNGQMPTVMGSDSTIMDLVK